MLKLYPLNSLNRQNMFTHKKLQIAKSSTIPHTRNFKSLKVILYQTLDFSEALNYIVAKTHNLTSTLCHAD